MVLPARSLLPASGMNDRETIREAIRAREIVRAKSFMNRPNPDCDRKPSEIKTTKVVKVEAVTAMATSLAPVMEAFIGE